MITTEELREIALSVVNDPWGIGNRQLERNSESWAPYNRFLHACVKKYKPIAVLECGVYMATATIHMALGNPLTQVIGIDIRYHENAYDNVRRYPNIWLIEGNTLESFDAVVAALVSEDNKIGLLFLDSAHDGVTPAAEFELYRPLFDKECIVVCDDIKINHEMEKFWEDLPGDKIRLDFLHPQKYTHLAYPDSGFGASIVRK